jgi:hypothetical protein
MPLHRHRAPLALVLVALLPACSGGADESLPPAELGYFEDIKPIVDAKCAGCHVAGGIAPFPLTSFDQVSSAKRSVSSAVATRRMPPWLAAPGCSTYADDRSLSDAQIATITRWVEQGAPAGDSKREGKPLDVGSSHALSRVDRSLAPLETFTASASSDEYRCFVLDWPETATTFVTGFRANPDDRRSVHHAIAFVASPEQVPAIEALDQADPGPGYPCYGGPQAAASWLGVWTPGSFGADFPEGTGIRVDPGSKVILQVHYSPQNGPPRPDRSSIDVKLDPSVGKEAWIQPWFDPSWYGDGVMAIPAGKAEVSYSVAYDPTLFITKGKPVLMYTAGLHMHALGKRGKITLERGDKSSECLLDIPRWQFHWQGAYGFETPRLIRPGDRISQECHWDNSAANQPVVNGIKQPPHDVDWGEAATDEMCLGGFYLTLE